jgi:hypothetical protein
MASIAALVVLAGCAADKPLPDSYTGPVAQLLDSGSLDGTTKVRLFVAEQIDGKPIANSLIATARASQRQGMFVTMQLVERTVPARPMKVKLKASHAAGESIFALLLWASGNFQWVEGVVDFAPEPDKTYLVSGRLDKDGSSVWIEDASTGQPVTDRVVGK